MMTSDNAAPNDPAIADDRSDSKKADDCAEPPRRGLSRRSRLSMAVATIALLAIIAALNLPYQFSRVARQNNLAR